ncbi:helix-turn-helix domain-containing protein [Gordonia amarae]|uniref:Helix-turn-helix domain-containing protein n=2 Tax=Gordonia amarae TaxID=36821 RepID=A0A857KNQ9_9ACTN|nr:helix-turn-helix domain-containing protein [Gordonia amarae]QHN23408.1 helix-turn-helix domain-containing protein [Gordonia amarae]QHN32309.1 helix-turn-helix domain-containing protein [Gordonia amarae]QHN41057.1 helix-turn-helix domain-containing protein [Gordonia amarae]GAB04115.1 putative Xre family DNA binding protein [Gordonia amarae NBRC 15530]
MRLESYHGGRNRERKDKTVDLDELLGIDLANPSHRLARLLADQDEALVDRLVQLRKDKRLSQQDVADAMGVTQSAVARIESGERDPRLSTLRRYAHAVGALIEHSVSSYDHERNLRDERPASRLAAVPAAVRDEQPRAIQQVLA